MPFDHTSLKPQNGKAPLETIVVFGLFLLSPLLGITFSSKKWKQSVITEQYESLKR